MRQSIQTMIVQHPIAMKPPFHNQTFAAGEKGFTLIEVIITMLMVGILAAVAGMGIVLFMQGYATTRENVAVAQKAALAMERITRELEILSDVDATSGDTCIRYRIGTESDNFRRIQYYDGKIELSLASTMDCDGTESGKTLTNRVKNGSLSFSYETAAGTATSPPANLSELNAIHLSFSLERRDGLASNRFNLTINPRNVGIVKGAGIRP